MATIEKAKAEQRRRTIENMVHQEYPYSQGIERARQEIIRLREAGLIVEDRIKRVIARVKAGDYVALDWVFNGEDEESVEVLQTSDLIEDLTNILTGKDESKEAAT